MMLSGAANAQRTISLSQAITDGLANKKNVQSGKLDLTISNLQTQAISRKYCPQVSADYTYFYNPILQTSIIPIGLFNPSYPPDARINLQFGTNWTQTVGITAIQPLFDLSIKRQVAEAKLQERIAALSQQQTENELAYTIAQTYINIYLEEAKVKSLIADTTRTYISYMLLKNKFDEQRLLKSDLNKSKVNHNNAVQLLADGIAQLIEDKVYLLYLMGASEMEKWDFELDSVLVMNYDGINTIDPAKLYQQPDLLQLELQGELSDLQAKSENTKHIPSLSFKGYLGANQYTNEFNPLAKNTWFGLSYLGLDMKIPILTGDSPHNKIQQLKLQSEQYNLQREDKILAYSNDLMTAKLKMDNIRLQLKTQAENITLSSESVAIFQARVNEGKETASNLNVEEANLQVLKANYETTKKQFWLSWLDYLKSTGQLSVLWADEK
jgi:outer membrane protein TolC